MTDHRLKTAIVALTVSLVSAPGWAIPSKTSSDYASYDETYGDEYQAADLARLTHVDNGIEVLRGHADPAGGPEAGARNDPVLVGDVLRTARDQRAELQLADGSLVRIDRGSEVRLQAMPDPYAEFRDNTVLALSSGTIQVITNIGEDETFRVDTPGATVYLLGSGDFRIDCDEDGHTRVWSRHGVAELAADSGSVLVRAGQRSDARPGAYPTEPEPFNTLVADAFDRWTQDRDLDWQAAETLPEDIPYDDRAVYEELPPEVRPHYGELSRNGRWVWVEDYGWSWYPVSVGVGWRPYVYGRWWYGPSGYFWCANEPWGWAPYHYGRWSHVPAYGWVWTPGRVFAGAWVSWSWGSAYVGWCPLNYWNRPVAYGAPYWGSYHAYSWTFVHYTHLTVHDYRRYAVPLDRIGGDLDGRTVSTRPPRVAPRDLRADARARGEAVRQVRSGRRPALDRGLDADAARTAQRSRERFRDVEDRFVSRGARERRVRDIVDRRPNDRTAARGPGSAPGDSDRVRGGGGARRTPVASAGSGRPSDVSRAAGEPRQRPRQIRGQPRSGDARVRDLYRRVDCTASGDPPRATLPVERDRVRRQDPDAPRRSAGRAGVSTPPTRDRRIAPPSGGPGRRPDDRARSRPDRGERTAPAAGRTPRDGTDRRRLAPPARGGRNAPRDVVRPATPRSGSPSGRTIDRAPAPTRRSPSAGRSSGRPTAPRQQASPPSRGGGSRPPAVRPAPRRSESGARSPAARPSAPARRPSASRGSSAPARGRPSGASRAPTRAPSRPKAAPARPRTAPTKSAAPKRSGTRSAPSRPTRKKDGR